MAKFLSVACEVSCRVRAGSCPAMPVKGMTSPQDVPVCPETPGPATYLGPPLLPWFLGGCTGGGRIRRPPDRPGTYARAQVRSKWRIHMQCLLTLVGGIWGT